VTSVKTTCAYCGVGCGIVATRTGERSATISGDKAHPANFGKLCSKGTHLGETIGIEGRLLRPELLGRQTGWDEALDYVANRFKATIAEHGPHSVAFYVSGQLLTEDYYVANKFMKGFIGTANIDTNSRLCMASAVAAHVRAFGEDIVPCSYSDLDTADLIILVGSNTAWCHPVIWQQIEAARTKRGTKIVVIDPRRTETAQRADLHLAIAPDSDVALFNGLLLEMRDRFLLDDAYMARSVSVPDGFWQDLVNVDVAKVCGLTTLQLQEFYSLFADNPRTVTLFSQGANQSVAGTDKANAIINVHLATGRIGKAGAGPFSITGQPNAMGGREVGGLASMLAAHMGFSQDERDQAQRFWKSPTMCTGPGLKAVDMFDGVADSRIKAIWVMATNPAISMPDAGKVRAALANCPLVVVSDCIAQTDTAVYAHVKLPALGWGEKDGTVTNSERVVSRQRGFLTPPGEAKPDWWIVAEVAKRIGWADAFDYTNAASIFREYAAQTGFENDGKRVLDISDKAHITDIEYEAMLAFQWGDVSPFAKGIFPTADGKARLVVTPYVPRDDCIPGFALRLNTGRYRDQWHSMTRTGLSPKLSQHRREPVVEVHPDTVHHYGLSDGGFAVVATPSGDSIFRVVSTDSQRQQDIFVPIHWTDQNSAGGRAGRLPGQERDPHSGQPGFKNTPATLRPYVPDWSGFVVSRTQPVTPDCVYWTHISTAYGWLTELAGDGDTAALLTMLPKGERAEMRDEKRGILRSAVIVGDQLHAALYIAKQGGLPPRDWLVDQLGGYVASSLELLAGRPAQPVPDRGPIICVCFDVGMTTILNAIRDQELTHIDAIGTALNAGTNCGSCRPAITRLLEDAAV
jgi:assimilatory nitrate reductase catalytic subunit